MDLKETTKWMNEYHDKHVIAHNKLNAIQRILDGNKPKWDDEDKKDEE